jgi:phospholipase/lecithinase/hemolysin
MRFVKLASLAAMAALVSGCLNDGNSNGHSDQNRYDTIILFGDSLSDVGTYNVGTVKALGGGKFTINGQSTTNLALSGRVWIEVLADHMDLPEPCAAQTGLDGDAAKGFSVPVVKHAGCFNYAQGGSRVSNPIGPGNKVTGDPVGATTVPVTTQIANHLTISGGKFKPNELVFVMAGGNDALFALANLAAQAQAAAETAGAAEGARVGAQTFATSLATQLASGATDPAAAAVAIGAAIAAESARAGHTDASIVAAAVATAAAQPGNAAVANPALYGPMVTRAQTEATAAGNTAALAAGNQAAAAVVANSAAKMTADMGTAGAELATAVREKILANGGARVVVNNLPDVSIAPTARAMDANIQKLIGGMVKSFNDALKAGLTDQGRVLYVDIAALSRDQATNPSKYGLTNVTSPACANNPLGGFSLVCTVNSLQPGDVSRYMFADGSHPTPYEHALIARHVAEQMAARNWL